MPETDQAGVRTTISSNHVRTMAVSAWMPGETV